MSFSVSCFFQGPQRKIIASLTAAVVVARTSKNNTIAAVVLTAANIATTEQVLLARKVMKVAAVRTRKAITTKAK